MELDGKALYEEHLSKTTNPGIQRILKMLIAQEEDHYKIFIEMEKNSNIPEVKQHSFADVKNIFADMKTESFGSEQADFYDKARAIELKAEKMYKDLAQEQTDDNIKRQILAIAAEEHKHAVILHNIAEMIRRPNQWVENAEFHHLEDY